MNIRLSTAFFGFCLLTSFPAVAADSAGNARGFGIGEGGTCSMLNADNENQKVALTKQNIAPDLADKWDHWLLGYLTGLNKYMPDTADILGSKNFVEFRQSLNTWCSENPDRKVGDGIDVIVQSLYPQRTKLKN